MTAEGAAKRIGLTPVEFEEKKFALFDRGFPRADETTGLYDLDAIDVWRRTRNPHLFGLAPLTALQRPRDAREIFNEKRRARG